MPPKPAVPQPSRRGPGVSDPAETLKITPERAAKMVEMAAMAIDGLSTEKIAERLDVHPGTVKAWRRTAAYKEEEERAMEELRDRLYTVGVANRLRRVQILNRLLDGWLAILDERAADPEMAYVPGGHTGMRYIKRRSIGAGQNFEVIEDVINDTDLTREIRDTLEQAAVESGQRVTKNENAPQGRITFTISPGIGPNGEVIEAEFDAEDEEEPLRPALNPPDSDDVDDAEFSAFFSIPGDDADDTTPGLRG